VGSQREKYGRGDNRISFFELLPILKEEPIKEPPFGNFFMELLEEPLKEPYQRGP
jgi:hypothetical protein